MLSLPDALQTALQHHQAGRLSEAETLYRQILQTQPNNPDALHLLGVIAHQTGKHEIAVEDIMRATALKPTAAEYHNNIGEAYRALARLNEAEASFQQALALKPAYAEAENNLGVILQAKGKLDEAVAHYRRAHELAPWETGYAIRAAWADRAAGEPVPTAAETAAIAKALRERPLPPTTLIALQSVSDCALAGEAACRDLTPALLDWLAAAEANPRLNAVGHQQIRINYGQLCLETNRFEQGLAWVQSAYRRSSQPVFGLMEANFRMLQGDLEGASAVLDEVRRVPELSATDAGHLAVLRDAIANRRAGTVSADGRPR